MEPWHFSHGETEMNPFNQATKHGLQWSHGILAMERSYAHGYHAQRQAASMEPWHFSHGEIRNPYASGCGTSRLQWSHGILAMESPGRARTLPGRPGFNGAMAF